MIKEDILIMSKARARERAKAKKGVKREAKIVLPAQKFGPGRFNPESSTIKSPRISNAKNFGGAKRGAGRGS